MVNIGFVTVDKDFLLMNDVHLFKVKNIFCKSKKVAFNQQMNTDVPVTLFEGIGYGQVGETATSICDGADLNRRGMNGKTPLIAACEKGHIDIVQELLAHDVQLDLQDEDGWTALIASSKEGYLEIVSVLLQHEADLNMTDLGGWSPLIWAAYKGNIDVVRELLKYGANSNHQGEHNMTALIWASGRGHDDIVKELIWNGAHSEVCDKYGTSALTWGCRKGHFEVVKLLIAGGASCNMAGTHGWTPLIMASKGGYADVVALLLEEDPNVNAVDQDGRSALYWASNEGFVEVALKLLERGAFINMPDNYGETSLMSAAKEGHFEVLKVLITAYAELDMTDNENRTALHLAAERGHLEVLNELINNGANMEVVSKSGDTPLLIGAKKQNNVCVKALLEKGANPKALDKNSDNVFHLAVRLNNRRMCQILSANQKNSKLLHQLNNLNETPLSLDAVNVPRFLSNNDTPNTGRNECIQMDVSKQQNVLLTTMADFLVEPSLTIPLSVGVFSKWGTGKSVYVQKLMSLLTELRDNESIPAFIVTMPVVIIVLMMATTIGLLIWIWVTWSDAIATTICIVVLALALLAFARVAVVSTSRRINRYGVFITHLLNRCMWFMKIVYCQPPSTSQVRSMLPVHLITVDMSHKIMVDDSPMTSLVNITSELTDAIEEDLGIVIPRLYRIFQAGPYRPQGTSVDITTRWKMSCCCIPSIALTVGVLMCLWVGVVLFGMYGIRGPSAVVAVQIACCCVLSGAVFAYLLRFMVILYCLVLSMKKRVKIVSSQAGIQEETFVSVLKQELDLCVDMIECIDGFAQQQTRVVINMDFLESLEQQKVLHLVNLCNLLLSEPGHPFILVLSVDPRLLIKAVDQALSDMQGNATDTPYHYLKNLIDLPFFISESVCMKIDGLVPLDQRQQLEEELAGENEMEWDDNADFQNSTELLEQSANSFPMNGGPNRAVKFPSNQSLNNRKNGYSRVQRSVSVENVDVIAEDLSHLFRYNENRSLADVKRIMNVVSLNGRILRNCHTDFQWTRLAIWVALCDEWPYKSSWLALLCLDNALDLPAKMYIRRVNNLLGYAMPIVSDNEVGADADESYFDTFIASHKPMINVGDVRKFAPFMSYIDPTIRKVTIDYFAAMKSGRSSKQQTSISRSTFPNSPSSSKCMWRGNTVDQQLTRMTVEDVANQVSKIDGIEESRLPVYTMRLHDNNINGRVLATCELNELRDVMQMKFGDWQLFKVWILTFLRKDLETSSMSRFADKISFSHNNSCLDGSQSESITECSPNQSTAQKPYELITNCVSAKENEGPYNGHSPQTSPSRQGVCSDKRKKITKTCSMSQETEVVHRNVEEGWHRSADSGFASTDVDPNSRLMQGVHRQNSLPERQSLIEEDNKCIDQYPHVAPVINVQQASSPVFSAEQSGTDRLEYPTWNGADRTLIYHQDKQYDANVNIQNALRPLSLSEVPLPSSSMLDVSIERPIDPPIEFTDQITALPSSPPGLATRKMALKNASKLRGLSYMSQSQSLDFPCSLEESEEEHDKIMETKVNLIRIINPLKNDNPLFDSFAGKADIESCL